MSVYFVIEGQTVWNPATRVGEVFLAYVKVLERIMAIHAGIGDIEADEVAIEP